MNWKRTLKLLQPIGFVLLNVACGPPPADLVLRNGKVVTVDDATPEAEIPGTRVVHTILGGRIAYAGEMKP